MTIVSLGSGPPVVVIPGIQGRWEWMRPGVEALAVRCRVITFSLADEPSCGGSFDESDGFGCYVSQVLDAMSAAGLERATICGVSYGGLIASAFAARHPERTSALVLVSALPPSWAPDARVNFYLRAPRLMMPLFMIASLRLFREIAAAHPGLRAALGAACRHGWNVLTHMFHPVRMARRVRLLASAGSIRLHQITAPTLVITGEPQLERVVPVAGTLEYMRLIPGARSATIERTGHLGVITRPQVFADLVGGFAADAEQHGRRRVG